MKLLFHRLLWIVLQYVVLCLISHGKMRSQLRGMKLQHVLPVITLKYGSDQSTFEATLPAILGVS